MTEATTVRQEAQQLMKKLQHQLQLEGEEEVHDMVAFTCRCTAAMRSVDSEQPSGLLQDPLARHLAGPLAMKLMEREFQALKTKQGTGKHLVVPQRSRLIDDRIAAALRQLSPADSQQPVQVVSLGCGMDTRPWRLQGMGPRVRWFDVDQPEPMDLKAKLLASAGAQTVGGVAAAGAGAGAAEVHGSAASAASKQQPAAAEAAVGKHQYQYPLLCGSYALCAADLSQVPLGSGALLPHGFDPSIPTIWVAEALLFYMPLTAACTLLHAVADLSALGSLLIATCIDDQMLDQLDNYKFTEMYSPEAASMMKSLKGLVYFGEKELLACPGFTQRWKLREQHVPITELAKRELGSEAYDMFKGSELLLVADVAGVAAAPQGSEQQ